MSVMASDHEPTQQHDFNWVKARRECSLSCEMQKLNDAVQASVDGKCRYQVDGEGERRRWKIVRKALEQLYFPSQA